MGIINFFRSWTNEEILYEEVINAQRKTYDNIKKDYIRRKEEFDNHIILSEVWASRKKLYIKTSMEELLVYGVMATTYISILEEENSLKALGSCFFIEESGNKYINTPTYEKAKQYYINAMVQKQHLLESNEKFEQYYKEKNAVAYAMIIESHGTFEKYLEKIKSMK